MTENVRPRCQRKYSSQGQCFLIDGVIARLKTEEVYGDGYRVNDDSDAFRHSYWNAYLTIEIGADITELYTNAHEFGFPSNFENETILGTKMDLYNNLQGRKIGVITSKDSVYKVIKNAVMTGKLVKIQGENLIPTNDNMKFEAI